MQVLRALHLASYTGVSALWEAHAYSDDNKITVEFNRRVCLVHATIHWRLCNSFLMVFTVHHAL